MVLARHELLVWAINEVEAQLEKLWFRPITSRRATVRVPQLLYEADPWFLAKLASGSPKKLVMHPEANCPQARRLAESGV